MTLVPQGRLVSNSYLSNNLDYRPKCTTSSDGDIQHVNVDSATITGTVTSLETALTTLGSGQTTVTTHGTRVALASSTTCKTVTIKAKSTNGGFIYVGTSAVSSSNGFILSAGDSISLDIANLNTINIDSSADGEGVSYIYLAA